jgi:hypothetical protein
LCGCTAFEGVEPGGADQGGAPGAGGHGAGPADTCLARSPSCFLPELEAVRLCARIAECPTLSTAIVMSTGIPVAETNASGDRIAFNFSTCVDWLTAPLENAHAGFAAVREELNCVIATATCGTAGDCLSFYPLPSDDARCRGQSGQHCENERLIDCDAALMTNCEGAVFPNETTCEEGDAGEATCRLGGCSAIEITCETDSAGKAYAERCVDGDQQGTVCSLFGLSCVEGIGCASGPASDVCDVPFVQSCDGEVVESCAVPEPSGDFTSARIDCAAASQSCDAPASAARCVPEGASCGPTAAEANQCSGSVLTLCVQGQLTDFDCQSLGLDCEDVDLANGISGRCR